MKVRSLQRFSRSRHSDSGMVSIMVTMVLMIVISLTVLGFAQISRKEQRQTLDRHLSTQAFFAAESGVNDAVQVISQGLQTGKRIEKKSCDAADNALYNTLNTTIDAGNSVSYTCMLVDTDLQEITQNIAADGSSSTIPIHPASGTISTVHVKWSLADKPASLAGCKTGVPASGTFSQVADWKCPYGVLRLDLVPTDAGKLATDTLLANQKTVFLYPVTGGSGVPSVEYGSANGRVAAMRCTTTECAADIINVIGGTNYGMRAMAIYAEGTIEVSAEQAGSALTLKDAQARVDVTGKAQDVLRRIQVRIPLIPTGAKSNYAIESGSSICKRFQVGTNVFRIPGDIQGQDKASNPMCKAVAVEPPPPPPPVCASPKDILMTLDYSNSMTNNDVGGETRLAVLKRVATKFVNNAGITATLNHAGLITYSATPVVRSAFTTNKASLIEKIQSTDTSDGTSFTAALNRSNIVLYSTGFGARTGVQKVVVFFADGDFGSRFETRQSALDAAKALGRKGVDLYVIGLIGEGSDESLLKALVQNDGTYARTSSASALQDAFDSVSGRIQCAP